MATANSPVKGGGHFPGRENAPIVAVGDPNCNAWADAVFTMDYEHPFVEQVRAHPHDDAPRLIYADYLEEAGDPQGELIRVQVALSHLAPGEPARRELELRESELLEEYADQWLAPLQELGVEGVSARSFQRGLIERVRMQASAFLINGADICRRAPALTTIELRSCSAHMRSLASQPLPQQISELDFSSNQLGTAELESLSWATWVNQIAGLSLGFNALESNAVRALVRVAWPRLLRLNLSVNRLDDGAAGALGSRSPPVRLAILNLSVNKIGDMGLQLLTHSPLASTLRELDVSSNGITTAGVARLVASPLLNNLESLSLRGNLLGEGSERALAALAHAPRLKRLDMRGTHRGESRYGYGAATLAPPAPLLERLGAGLLW
jgi:uncharacterized protein (TIGR02996 family)